MKKIILLSAFTLLLSACGVPAEDAKEHAIMQCRDGRVAFDIAVEQSRMAIQDNEMALCYQLNLSTVAEIEEPRWGIGALTDISADGMTWTLRGNTETEKFQVAEGTRGMLGQSYRVDMMNLCRQRFMLIDSRAPSPLWEQMHSPEPVDCAVAEE